MALSFPIDLPYCLTERSPFIPVRQQALAITGGGSVNAAEVGPPLWRCEFATSCLNRETFEGWQAWLASLRGGIRMFKGRPPLRDFPLTYPHGFSGLTYLGSPFDGNGNLSAIGTDRDSITINQVANGLILKPGDWLSLFGSPRQHLHRIVEGGTASGNAITVGIEPTLRPGLTTGRLVRFHKPYCEMVLEGGTFQAVPNGRGGSISFTGIQVLL